MRFVCLIHHDRDWFEHASPAERQKLHDESMAYDAELSRRGHLVVAHALRPPAEAKAIRVRRKPVIADGPYAETKEQLIGFILIDAKNMEEATAIASQIPLARTGTVELREAYFAAEEGPGS